MGTTGMISMVSGMVLGVWPADGQAARLTRGLACDVRLLRAQVITAVIFSPIQFDALAHAITGTVLTVLTIVQARKYPMAHQVRRKPLLIGCPAAAHPPRSMSDRAGHAHPGLQLDAALAEGRAPHFPARPQSQRQAPARGGGRADRARYAAVTPALRISPSAVNLRPQARLARFRPLRARPFQRVDGSLGGVLRLLRRRRRRRDLPRGPVPAPPAVVGRLQQPHAASKPAGRQQRLRRQARVRLHDRDVDVDDQRCAAVVIMLVRVPCVRVTCDIACLESARLTRAVCMRVPPRYVQTVVNLLRHSYCK